MIKSFQLAVVTLLLLFGSRLYAQDQLLTNWPAQAGMNVQVGQLASPLQVQGLNIRDPFGNLLSSIPLLTNPSSVSATTTLGDTLYAVFPPDANNQVTIAVMYQLNGCRSFLGP
jgi:hypothetical protein